MSEGRKNIVVIGGGTGSSVALRGLKTFSTRLTAIVTMFDSGGSTGILRDEFGYPPLGDIRQCLLALSPSDSEKVTVLNRAFDFRFESKSSLKGHSVGNLILAALTTIYGGVQGAIDELSDMLELQGQVVPVTLGEAHLGARLIDGETVLTESAIDLRGANGPSIREVFLDRNVKPNPRAIDALISADAILLGPGDLYTSVLPNLLVDGVSTAIRESGAPVIYACNLMTKLGETDGYGAWDFASEVVRYLAIRKLDYLLVNRTKFSKQVLDSYADEDASPVAVDSTRTEQFAHQTIVEDIAQVEGLKIRHNSGKLAQIVMSAI